MTRGVALSIGFAGLLALLLWVSAQSFVAATARVTTYRYIAEALSPVATQEANVNWQEPTTELARPVTEGDQTLIGKAMTTSWQVLATAQSTARTDILSEAFSGVALERAQLSVRDATEHGGRMAVLSQNARPIFFHLDGSLFQAEVELIVARYVTDADGLVHHSLTRDKGVVTLTNETTGWRVFAYERTDAVSMATPLAGWKAEALNGVNYYPATSPWRAFWEEFEVEETRRDLRRLRDLNANSIRIFISRADFIGAEESAAALGKLASFLQIAETEGLRVVPTLFDMRGAYGPGMWAADFAYLERVLPVLRASPAVSLIDLKNEPDLDFETHGRGEVEAWLRTMSAAARTIAPELAQTVGWSSADMAEVLSDALDVITYHDYASIEGAGERLRAVQTVVPGKPVLVTEIGASSFGFALGFPGSPTVQAKQLAQRLSALSPADGVFIWTLYDFDAVDTAAVGASPWVKRLQAKFGLLAIDGSEKPAANVVREAFAAGS